MTVEQYDDCFKKIHTFKHTIKIIAQLFDSAIGDGARGGERDILQRILRKLFGTTSPSLTSGIVHLRAVLEKLRRVDIQISSFLIHFTKRASYKNKDTHRER